MPNKSSLYATEPDWITCRPGTHHRMPESVQSWVYEPHSLTQRLREYYGNTVSVRILLHQWRKPFLSERKLLALPHDQYSLIREVVLCAHEQPLILARTVIPAKTLSGTQRILSNLGNRPLGEIIFSYPKLQRLEMNIASIAPQHWSPALQQTVAMQQSIWGRRTVYSMQNRQMLVSEFFLPEILSA